MTAPAWIAIARKYEGTAEVKGPGTHPLIAKWLAALGAWWRDDETPWCGVFAGAVLREAGADIPKAYYRAREWETWGMALSNPVVGCIVTFTRVGGGHVGFVVGETAQGDLLVLGGNQGDQVSIAAFDPARAIGYRWPADVPLQAAGPLPVMASAPLSRSEA